MFIPHYFDICPLPSFIIIIRFRICTIASANILCSYSTVDLTTNANTEPIPWSNRHPLIPALRHADEPHRPVYKFAVVTMLKLRHG
jgi:hypothetical protein